MLGDLGGQWTPWAKVVISSSQRQMRIALPFTKLKNVFFFCLKKNSLPLFDVATLPLVQD